MAPSVETDLKSHNAPALSLWPWGAPTGDWLFPKGVLQETMVRVLPHTNPLTSLEHLGVTLQPSQAVWGPCFWFVLSPHPPTQLGKGLVSPTGLPLVQA